MKLILLPGLDGTGVLFEPLAAAMPRHIEPIVVAYPNDPPLGYDELTELVASRLPASEPFTLLGESFSGVVALRVAARRPAALAGVILCGAFVRNPTWLPRHARAAVGAWLFPFWKRSIIARLRLGREPSAPLLALFRKALALAGGAAVARRAREILTVDAEAELLACEAPILYLAGARDFVVPSRNLRHILRLRGDVRTVTLNAPHWLLQTVPIEAAKAIAEFVRSLP